MKVEKPEKYQKYLEEQKGRAALRRLYIKSLKTKQEEDLTPEEIQLLEKEKKNARRRQEAAKLKKKQAAGAKVPLTIKMGMLKTKANYTQLIIFLYACL